MARDRSQPEDAVRITTAATNRQDDIRARQRRYLLSMSLRTLCFIGAVIVREGVFMWVLIAAAIFLPYVAVVMANATANRGDGFQLQDASYGRPQLSSGSGPSGS